MIHRIDGTRIEKYYVGGSLSLAIMLGILSYLSGQLTYDPVKRECYTYDPDRIRGLLWQIGIQHLWSLLTMAGEIVTFSSILVYMIRLKVFESGPRSRRFPASGLSASHHYRKPLGPKQYRNVVLRIALYPLSSLATVGVLSIWTLYNISTGRKVPFKVLVALRLVYLSRGLVYGLVAAIDPAITQGVKILYRHYIGRRTSTVVLSVDANQSGDIELQELSSSGDRQVTTSGSSHAELGESMSSIVLPPPSKSVLLSPLTRETGLDTVVRPTPVDTAVSTFESRVGDGHRYMYPELRQL